MTAPRTFRIDVFPAGQWQVIWYGDLSYAPDTGLHSQPTISLLLQAHGEQPCSRRRIAVAFSLIAAIPLASIWKNGERIDERPVEDLVARKIDVIPSQAELVRAGGRLDDSPTADYLLPFRYFSLHEHDTASYCLRWTTEAGEIVLLPAVEAMRFYFGTSSFLLKRVVVGDPPLDRMWTDITLDEGTRKAHLRLADDVPVRKRRATVVLGDFDTVAQIREAIIEARVVFLDCENRQIAQCRSSRRRRCTEMRNDLPLNLDKVRQRHVECNEARAYGDHRPLRL